MIFLWESRMEEMGEKSEGKETNCTSNRKVVILASQHGHCIFIYTLYSICVEKGGRREISTG
jgi:hypothetical protein